MAELFDDWTEKYDQWFESPIGRLIKGYEKELICQMLNPKPGETILDAGCGTGIFSQDILETGAHMVGLELSMGMLRRAQSRFMDRKFEPVQADMIRLPFSENTFHKTVSITAIEFIKDAKAAVDELFRVTQPGGVIVVSTLNALSPWANRRKKSAQSGHSLFRHAVFRSPEELLNLSSVKGFVQTAVHFQKDEDPDTAQQIEISGQNRNLNTGAFLAACWKKPVVELLEILSRYLRPRRKDPL